MKTKTKLKRKGGLLTAVITTGVLIVTQMNASRVIASCPHLYASQQMDPPSDCSLNEEEGETGSTLGGGGCVYYYDAGGYTFCRNSELEEDCVDDTSVLPNDGHLVYAYIVRTYCKDGQCTWDSVSVSGSDTVEIPSAKYKQTVGCPNG